MADLNPLDILKDTAQRLPILNYAYGVVGLAAAASLVLSFIKSPAFAIVAVVLILIGMIMLWVVYTLQKGEASKDPAVKAVVWIAVVFFAAVLGLMLSAATFRQPEAVALLLDVPFPVTDDDKKFDYILMAAKACSAIDHKGVLSSHQKSEEFYENCIGPYCQEEQDEEMCAPKPAKNAALAPRSYAAAFFSALLSAQAEPSRPVARRPSGHAAAPPPSAPAAPPQPSCIVDTQSAKAAVLGADISHHDKADWSALKNAGYSFAVIKASQGASFKDANFQANWRGAGALGFSRGIYHYLNADNGEKQAQNFLSAIKGAAFGPCDLGVALVLEKPPGASDPQAQLAAARAWLARVAAATKRVPIVYTTDAYFTGELGSPGGFEKYPLWIASYKQGPPPAPKPWSRYTLWQFSDGYSPWPPVPFNNAAAHGLSMSRHVSSNLFNGSPAQFHALLH